MKTDFKQIYLILITTGFVLFLFFLFFKPWNYFNGGMMITTAEEFYKHKGKKVNVETEIYPTGYSAVDAKGDIAKIYYSIIIENIIVIVPLKDTAESPEMTIKGIVTDLSKNSDLYKLKEMINEKYEEPSPTGVLISAHLADYYIKTDYLTEEIFTFITGILSVLSLITGFCMRAVYKKNTSLEKSVISFKVKEKSIVEESLIRDCIYSDDFMTMSKSYLKYGNNSNIIKITNIDNFKLIYNELIIKMKNGNKIVIPAIDENQMRSIQKCYNALLIYMPEITGN